MDTRGASPDRLTATFAALADPNRRAILAQLQRGKTSVGDLAKAIRISQPAVSKHLRVLEGAGLIEREAVAQKSLISATTQPLRSAAQWLEGFADALQANYARLDALLDEMKREAAGVARPQDKNGD